VTAAGVLSGALLGLSALVVLLVGSIAAARVLRARRIARSRRLSEPVRPLLMELIAGEPTEQQAAAKRLSLLDAATWRAVEPSVVALLGKVRGEGGRGVVSLLERQGVLAAAERDLVRRGAVRRAAAAELLGAAGQDTAVDRLVTLLHDRTAEVRLVAARALGRIGAPRAAGPLVTALGEGRVPVQVAAQALLRIGAPAGPALTAALDSPSPLVRVTAVEILGRVGAVGAFAQLGERLQHDDVPVRARAATAVGRLGLPRALEVLVRATAADQAPTVRVAAVRALGELGAPGAVEHLTPLLGDADPSVAGEAGPALAALGPCGRNALSTVAAEAPATAAAGRAEEALATAALAAAAA
jgi:HEAT repeats